MPPTYWTPWQPSASGHIMLPLALIVSAHEDFPWQKLIGAAPEYASTLSREKHIRMANHDPKSYEAIGQYRMMVMSYF